MQLSRPTFTSATIGERCAAVPASPPEDPSVHACVGPSLSDSVTFPDSLSPALSLLPLPVLCSNGSSSNDASEQPATAQTAAMLTTIDVPRGGAVCGDAGDV